MSLPIADTPLDQRPALPEPRAGSWNHALAPALIAAPGLDAIHARLKAPGALVVTTGQQPGLFTGPAYAVSKALSARALARFLSHQWNRPVVPLYWVPSDDHDFDEVASVAWLSGEGDFLRAALTPRASDAPLTPMYRQPLGASVEAALAGFESSLPESPSRAQTSAWLRRHYRADATVGGAFGGAMAELLAPFGVACLDSTHPAVKLAAAPVVLGALAKAPELERALVARAAELDAEGRSASVPVGDGATLVFIEGPMGRDRLVTNGPNFVSRRTRTTYTRQELERIAVLEPTRFSGNVLLRPAVESALLPTVAYVAGPGELRYLALAEPLYGLLGIPRQLPVPRWSGLFIEPRVTRVLTKFGATLLDLLDGTGGLEARLARQALPPGTEASFRALKQAIATGYEPVIAAAAAVDPTMERPAAAARGQALHAAEELEKKLLQHARKRESVELAQVARARLSVRPEGNPQDRVLTMAYFLARYGWDVLDALAGHVEGWYGAALEAGSRTA